MPYAAVNDIQDTLNHKHGKGALLLFAQLCVFIAKNSYLIVLARNMVHTIEHPTCGPIKLINTPVKFSESEPSIRSPPPTLGQHTVEVLTSILGLSEQEVANLKAEAVVA